VDRARERAGMLRAVGARALVPAGQWYIYVAADDGNNANHRMYVLESTGSDAQGGYISRGRIAAPTDRWAIDGTVLQRGASLYFLWSGWAGAVNAQQNLYIAPMSNPWTISGERVLLSEPTQIWERRGGDGVNWPYINEGPQVLQRNGKVFLVYSASGSWTDDYCLGMLTASDSANLLLRSSWTKSSGCVFSRAAAAYGPGHNSFTTSPDFAEDWHVYHANTSAGSGWGGRSLRIQKITWSTGGDPVFGTPVAADAPLAGPSGERYEAENAVINRASARAACCGASNGEAVGYRLRRQLRQIRQPERAERGRVRALGALRQRLGRKQHARRLGQRRREHRDHVSAHGLGQLVHGDDPRQPGGRQQLGALLAGQPLRRARLRRRAQVRGRARDRQPCGRAQRLLRGVQRIGGRLHRSCGQLRRIRHGQRAVGGRVHAAGALRQRLGREQLAPGVDQWWQRHTGWDNWSTVTTTVNLAAGNNRIRFARGALYAEIDCIELYR
jgi:GH43 family beta-xylosidase